MPMKPEFRALKRVAAEPVLEPVPGLAREDQLFLERFVATLPKAAQALAARAAALESDEAFVRDRLKLDRSIWQAFYRAALPLAPMRRDYWAALLLMTDAPLSALTALESALSQRHPSAPRLLRLALLLQVKHKLGMPLAHFQRFEMQTESIQILPADKKSPAIRARLARPPAVPTWLVVWDRPGSLLMGLAEPGISAVSLSQVAFPEYAKRKAPQLWVGEARTWVPLDDAGFLLLGEYLKRREPLAMRLASVKKKTKAAGAGEAGSAIEFAARLLVLGPPPPLLDSIEQWTIAQESQSKQATAAAAKLRKLASPWLSTPRK